IERSDRIRALNEACRVLGSNGVVLAAAISRFASALDGLARHFFSDPRYVAITWARSSQRAAPGHRRRVLHYGVLPSAGGTGRRVDQSWLPPDACPGDRRTCLAAPGFRPPMGESNAARDPVGGGPSTGARSEAHWGQ